MSEGQKELLEKALFLLRNLRGQFTNVNCAYKAIEEALGAK